MSSLSSHSTVSLTLLRTSNDCVEHLYHLVMTQLNEEHSEVRLSAFQIATELFSRSHHFRMLLVENFQVNQSDGREPRRRVFVTFVLDV